MNILYYNEGEPMRFYNIYYLCKLAYEDLKRLKIDITTSGSRKIISWPIYKQALSSLYTISFIKDDARSVCESLNVFDRDKISPEIGMNTYHDFMERHKVLITKLNAIIDLYESIKNDTSKPGIDIKLPSCKTLNEYISILKDIDFILFQCPYFRNKGEDFQYTGTDVGSDWITFAIVTTGMVIPSSFILLNNLAALKSKAIALKSNKKILDMQEETINTMQTKNEITQETIDVFDKLKEITYKKYVDELKSELGEVDNGEEEAKVALSLEKLSSLIDKGLEIYSSIETPKEIKVLFPIVDTQEALPESLIKYLEDKSIKKE